MKLIVRKVSGRMTVDEVSRLFGLVTMPGKKNEKNHSEKQEGKGRTKETTDLFIFVWPL